MKAQELRIGLWMKSTVMDLNFFKLTIDDIVNEVKNKQHNGLFEPIPLTEEWLLKFGFIQSEDDQDHYFFQNFDISLSLNIVLYVGVNIKYCEYVHQLQNLHFALTGQELEINE